MRGRSCHGPGMDVRGQLVKGSSLLPQCGIQGMDLVLRLGSKLPLPAEPSPESPSFLFLKYTDSVKLNTFTKAVQPLALYISRTFCVLRQELCTHRT